MPVPAWKLVMAKRHWTLLLAYMAIVAAVSVWMANGYVGPFMVLAEWQFQRIDGYLPSGTALLLIVAFSLPALLLLGILRLRRAPVAQMGEAVSTFAAARAHLLLGLRLFRGAAVVFGCCALGAGWMILFPPGTGPGAGHVDIARIGVGAPLPDGPASVSGGDFDRQVVYYRQLAAIDDGVSAFVGVHPRSGGPAILYVELAHPGGLVARPSQLAMEPRAGVLVRNGLPRALLPLLAGIGHPAPDPHYALYLSEATLRRPYVMACWQFVILSMICALAAWAQSRRIARIERLGREEQPSV